jgi:hypothetical protein
LSIDEKQKASHYKTMKMLRPPLWLHKFAYEKDEKKEKNKYKTYDYSLVRT